MKLPSALGGFGMCLMLAGIDVQAASAVATQDIQPYPQGSKFPLEIYEAAAGDVPALAAHGWNTFQSYQNRDPDEWDAYLTALATNHVTGLAAIPCFGPMTNKTAWPQARVQTWVRGIAGNSNLAWWDLPEEARPWSAREMKLLQNYRAWARLTDPLARPVYEYTPNNRNAAEIAHIVAGTDVIGLSCYCEEMRMPHAWVRYKIQEAGLHGIKLAGASVGGDYRHGQKIPVAVIYCAKSPRSGTMPSPAQSYHDFWSAVVSGARGIGVFAYHHAMADDPALARDFLRLDDAAREISGPEKIGDAILWGEPDTNVAFEVMSGPKQTVVFRPPTEKVDFQYPSINLMAKARDGLIYVITVNSTAEAVTARITGLPAEVHSAWLPVENSSIPVSGGCFINTFAPWGVHVCKIAELRREP